MSDDDGKQQGDIPITLRQKLQRLTPPQAEALKLQLDAAIDELAADLAGGGAGGGQLLAALLGLDPLLYGQFRGSLAATLAMYDRAHQIAPLSFESSADQLVTAALTAAGALTTVRRPTGRRQTPSR